MKKIKLLFILFNLIKAQNRKFDLIHTRKGSHVLEKRLQLRTLIEHFKAEIMKVIGLIYHSFGTEWNQMHWQQQ